MAIARMPKPMLISQATEIFCTSCTTSGAITTITSAPGPSTRPGVGRGVAVERLQHLRNQHRAAEQRETEHEIESVRDGEISFFEQRQFHHGVGITQLPNHRRNQRHDRDRKKYENEVALEPVFAFAAIQHHFQAGEADRHQRDPDVIDAELSGLPRLFPLRA